MTRALFDLKQLARVQSLKLGIFLDSNQGGGAPSRLFTGRSKGGGRDPVEIWLGSVAGSESRPVEQRDAR